MDWSTILPAAAIIVGALLLIAKTISKLTPSTKDDEVVGKIADAINPIIESLDGDDKESK